MKKILFIVLFITFSSEATVSCDDIEVSDQIFLCSKKSFEQSDDILNDTYKKLLSKINTEYSSNEKLKSEYVNKVKLSQRAWISFRDKNCEAFSFQIEPGTQAHETSLNLCKNKMTQKRIKDLIFIGNQ
ncbi:lysozyme inhibitor LprI family protein [Rahnella contaminans]|uniref:lysozyme inhibitor LprI family protein n=1 Tax=Rahnella contaminans TaxID=2703882 RepID=UPI0023DBE9E6|nr:lysozyme inhibitor LprI family protein [Rahnella contaminans]MDF1897173.1 DUF1311 domain-containing protein [Rahnella contaminans]